MRVVLDTNIIVSALNYTGSNPDKVFTLVLKGEIGLIISPFILSEVQAVLEEKFLWTKARAKQAGKTLITISTEIVSPKQRIRIIKAKEADNRILECAVGGGADFIVTGDKKHLLPLKRYEGIQILAAADFLNVIGGGE